MTGLAEVPTPVTVEACLVAVSCLVPQKVPTSDHCTSTTSCCPTLQSAQLLQQQFGVQLGSVLDTQLLEACTALLAAAAAPGANRRQAASAAACALPAGDG